MRSVKLRGLQLSEAWYAGETRIPRHQHDHPCMTLVLEGGFTETDAHSDCPVRAQHVIAKPAGVPHWDVIHPGGVRSVHIVLQHWWDEAYAPFVCGLSQPLQRRDGRTDALAREIARELQTDDSVRDLSLEGLALQAIAHVARPLPKLQRTRPPWLDRVLEYLRASFAEELHLDAVARTAGIHPSHLARVFRTHMGCSIGAHVRELRLQSAWRLLTSTDIPLGAVAQMAGFYDQSHLTSAFKARYGEPPGQYRTHRGRRAPRRR